jgi:hypothetical protein
MLGERLIAAGGAKLISALAIACLLLFALLILSAWGNWYQFRSHGRTVTTLASQLAASEAKGAAELNACAGVNKNVVATVQVLGDELHACRGEEQRIDEARALALRQRDRARQDAESQARMRSEAIEAIARRDESCNRPVCRALSDELLGRPADGNAE